MNIPPAITGKQAEILAAARQAFARHGYRRSAMEDIAREAGMSRPALYLHYRSKEDIFRHLVEQAFADAIAGMETALATPARTVEDTLVSAFRAKDGALIEVIFTSPHGEDLLAAAQTVAADIFRRGEEAKIALLARWLSSLALPPDIGPPETVARTILNAAMGLKFPGQTLDGYRQGQIHLARLFARALA